MRPIRSIVVVVVSLFLGVAALGPAGDRPTLDALVLENAELKLEISGLEAKVASLEAALDDCLGGESVEASDDEADSPDWLHAITLRVRSVEPIGLLESEFEELGDLEAELRRLEGEYDKSKSLADRLEEENRRESKPYRNFRGTLINPLPPNSPESIREAKGKSARLRNDIRQTENRIARLNRLKVSNRVLVRGTHPAQETSERRVLLSGKPASDAMQLTAGTVIEVQLVRRSSLGSDDAVEGRMFRNALSTPETESRRTEILDD